MLRVDTVWNGLPGAPYFSSHFFDGPDDQTTADLCAAAVREFWLTISPAMSNNLTGTIDPTVTAVDAATGNPIGTFAVSPGTFTPSDSANTLPRTSQGLLRILTGVYVAGRQIRGRLFIPGPCIENDTDLGQPLTAYLAVVNGAGADLISTGLGWGVWSRKNGTFAPAITASTWTEWAILRSRRD